MAVEPLEGKGRRVLPTDVGASDPSNLLFCWFDQEVVPTLFLNRDLELLLCNSAARSLIHRHSTLRLKGDRFSSNDAKQCQEIHDIVQSPESGARSIVLKKSGRADTLLQVQPINVSGEAFYGVKLHPLEVEEDDSIVSEFADHFGVTPTEGKILLSLVGGNTSREIAEIHGSSHETVRSHIRNIYKKLNISSRIELMKLYHAIMS